ncbi:hypothetical protein AKJ61_04665, partial [candidate division MSBL1 archaeon SCGC-AAA259B11]
AKNSGKIINSIIILAALIFLISSLTPAASANVNNDNEKPIVVATTTNLGYFANEVGGNNIEVLNLVPAGACPGHYDTRPTDVEAIVDADLILWNGFEPWLMELVESAGNREVLMNKGPGGEWGPPPRKLFRKNIYYYHHQKKTHHTRCFDLPQYTR